MRWIAKLKLCFADTRTGKISKLRITLLLLAAVFTLHLNWSNKLSDTNCETGCNEDDFLTCSQNGAEVITKSSVREIGKPLNRTVFLTIGIPTVQRIFQNKTASYLMDTLNSLLNKDLSQEDLADMLIVIFLADPEESAREEVKRELRSNFGKYLNMNLIHVIVAPPSFYPQLTELQRTLGDSQERMYWRSKQSMDYVFMFYYSQGLSQYYLQLEDDVLTEPNYMKQIREFIDLKSDTEWAVLRFSSWGFIGKLVKNKDLRTFGRFLAMFYNEMPVDWLLGLFMQLQAGQDFSHQSLLKPELFHHIGRQSSSLGT